MLLIIISMNSLKIKNYFIQCKMTDQISESVIIQHPITPTETKVVQLTSVQDSAAELSPVQDTAELTSVQLIPVQTETENNTSKIDILQEILKANANLNITHNSVALQEEEDIEDEEEVYEIKNPKSLRTSSEVVKGRYPSNVSSSESSDFESMKRKNVKRKPSPLEIIPDIGFSAGNSSKTFDNVREMIAYNNKHKETFHNYNTQKINRMFQCEGYKFSKIGGNFNIVAAETSTSKPRETWKNKSIELEKIMQTIQHNYERLQNNVDVLTSKLVKAYSKISSQSHDIENLTKVVTNMCETQIPALTNKINKSKLANKYAR